MEQERIPDSEVRTMSSDDVERVVELYAALCRSTYPDKDHGITQAMIDDSVNSWETPELQEKIKQYYEKGLGDPERLFCVAEHSGQIVGLLETAIKQDGAKYLGRIFVSKDLQGKGVADNLMDVFDEWAGGEDAILDVAIGNQRAIGFYERRGFKVISGSEHPHEQFPQITAVTMRREGLAEAA